MLVPLELASALLLVLLLVGESSSDSSPTLLEKAAAAFLGAAPFFKPNEMGFMVDSRPQLTNTLRHHSAHTRISSSALFSALALSLSFSPSPLVCSSFRAHARHV